MNWLDIVLLIVVAGSILTSLRKGLTREIIGLVSVVLALLAGTWFYGMPASYLMPYVSARWIANLAGFVLVFVGVLLAGGVISAVAGKLLKISGLSFVDHLMGAGFGMARGVLVAVALMMAITAFSPAGHPPEPVVQSRLAPYVLEASRACAAVAPYELKEGFRKTYAQVRAAWADALKKGIGNAKVTDERKI